MQGIFVYPVSMRDLVRGVANDPSNPRVVFAWQSPTVGDSNDGATVRRLRGGFFMNLADPLTYRVLRPDGTELVAATNIDPTDEANQLDPVSTGGKGRLIVPTFTVDVAEPVGLYTLEVTFTAVPTDGPTLDPQTVSYTFRVLDEDLGYVDAYAQLTDLLAAGFPVGDPTPVGGFSPDDARRALLRATAYINDITRRFFEPRYQVLDVNGKGGPVLQIEPPIAGLTDVSFTFTTFSPADLPIEEGDLRVYNRHLRQGMVRPDDREDPRIEFLRTPVYRYPRAQLMGETDLLSSYVGFVDSQQNVKLRGVFGYTDPDGSPFGCTPLLIRECTMRLAARYIEPLWSQMGGAGNRVYAAGPVTNERTMDQSVSYANAMFSGGANTAAFIGAFTGDPEIDNILVRFMAPPMMGSA